MASKFLSTDQLNFTRLGIGCVDIIKLALRDILKIHIQPKDLYIAINSCSQLKTGRYKLRPEQERFCFFPLPLVPDYDNFDVSLLYTLIRYLCPHLYPAQGWGNIPTAADMQIGDDIERVRIFRNKMHAHLKSSSVTDIEFTSKWKTLKIILVRIQRFVISKGYNANYEKEIESIEKTDFGIRDLERCLYYLEAMMQLLKYEEIPRISINGRDKVLCGETTFLEATVEHPFKADTFIIIWQRVSRNGPYWINTRLERYEGSTNRRLVIKKVSKEDEGEYQALISWEKDGQNHDSKSNCILLNVLG
ncbi:uncharacterized protein LOC134241039, partial [Saccostrea cucullata]|uniref:uncharacterized protein LOC134241039 n=1 Tax=Saccostrea cuccullata TaxID=36930 RepID=UPI002ED53359